MIGREEPFDKLLNEFNEEYTQQIVIDFINEPIGKLLVKKWNSKHPDTPCESINGDDLLEQRCKILHSEKYRHTRIYVIIHGNEGILGVSEQNLISIKKLAAGLVHLIGDQPLSVNLIACLGAVGDIKNPSKNLAQSAAAKLHSHLVAFAKRDIPVFARMQIIVTSNMGNNDKKFTYKLNNPIIPSIFNNITSENKQPGSKVLVCLDSSGNQIILDAYLCLWKAKFLRVLNNAQATTSNPDKQAKVQSLLEMFSHKSQEAIFKILEEEIINPTHLALFVNTRFFPKITSLVKERKKILASKHTFHEPKPTGVKMK